MKVIPKRVVEEPEIAVVGTKGQIVIPKEMRRQLAIMPKTPLAVYRRGDKLVLMKLTLPTVGHELDSLVREIDEQNRGKKVLGDRDILQEIEARRKERRTKQGV